MFIIKDIVIESDKKLGDFLRACAGLVTSMSVPQPMINVEKKGGKLTAPTNGTLPNMLVHHLKKNNITNVNSAEVKNIIKKLGRSPNSSTYALVQATKEGFLKRSGKGSATRYEVL